MSSSRRAARPTRLSERGLPRLARRPARRAPCPGRGARPGPVRGSCPGSGTAPPACGPPSSVTRRAPPAGWAAAARSATGRPRDLAGVAGGCRRVARRRPRRRRARARAAGAPRGPRASRPAASPGRPRVPFSRDRATQWKNSAEITAAIGIPKMAPGDARDLRPDDHRRQDHDRVDADRARHEPRLEDVHRHEPRDAHEDQHREHAALRASASPRPRAAATTRTARRTGSSGAGRRRPS